MYIHAPRSRLPASLRSIATLVVGLCLAVSFSLHAAGQAVLLKDINPGTYSIGSLGPTPRDLAAVGDKVFFSAYDINNGFELWVSDGTTAGTRLVRDIASGGADSSPANGIDVNGMLFFTARTDERNQGLWKSDGTAAGTVLITPIRLPTYPSFAVVGATLFFVNNAASGTELWKSDGTTAGTVLVKDITPGNNWEGPFALTNVNGTLFFIADDGTHGYELWKSNGTQAGTVLVKDITPSGPSFDLSDGADLIAVGNTLFYTSKSSSQSQRQLWKSDGTAAGTVLVDSDVFGVADLTNLDGTLFFHGTWRIDPMGTLSTGLWKSNGTAAGTVEVRSFYTGTAISTQPYDLTSAGGQLFFNAGALWTSDGTAGGTIQLTDDPIGDQLGTAFLKDVNGTLFFFAGDGSGGLALWKSDGTKPGTTLIKTADPTNDSHIWYPTAAGSRLFFGNTYDQARGLWVSDGTPAGTLPIKDTTIAGREGSDWGLAGDMAEAGGRLFFRADEGANNSELWVSDGTPASTRKIEIHPTGASRPSRLTSYKGQVFFSGYNGQVNGLWKSDGTSGGTIPVRGFGGFALTYLTNHAGLLYFFASDGPGVELWKSDGTATGTTQVGPINSKLAPLPQRLTSVGSRLFFIGPDSDSGYELWTSDGTAAGTKLLKNINTVGLGSDPFGLTDVHGTLFFFVSNGPSNGYELWKSNGTPEGTVQVKVLYRSEIEGSAEVRPPPGQIVVFNNTM